MELPLYKVNAIAKGFFYECSCGELYCHVDAAVGCRKCWNYTEKGTCTEVYDIATGKMVWESLATVRERELEAERAAYQAEAARPFTVADHIDKNDLITAIL